ncbi:MAG TPA: RHS repeat-associated core domain-containing protein, partial [Pyrinomonadaceae bacterium]|nr:RHS repeat-associated core domain-containing protein [Pyrinomonadaceae bacterium]
ISVIRKESDNSLVQAFQYGSTNARLMDTNYGFGYLKLFASTGGTTLAEYTEFTGAVPTWTKSFTYLGDKQLATVTPNGSGGEYVEFNHPDRLGTRLVTNQAGGTAYEQVHLPFGTALNAESSITENPRRFTSYDRSSATGLDYAINRTYDSKAGRFTQVDPIGLSAVDFLTPQTLNLYSYCANDPVNHVDSDGLFFGKLFKAIGSFLKKAFKWIAVAVSVAVAVLTIAFAPYLFATTLKMVLGIIAAVANAAQSVLSAFGLNRAAAVFSIISGFASFGTSLLDMRNASAVVKLRAILRSISSGATAVSRTLAFMGHRRLSQVFGLVANVSGFIADGLKDRKERIQIDGVYKDVVVGLEWKPSHWKVYKLVRSSAEQLANLSGSSRAARFFNAVGIFDDAVDIHLGIKGLYKNTNGGDEVFYLDAVTNKRLGPLTGPHEFIARSALHLTTVTRRQGAILGTTNRMIGRIERVAASVR